MSVDRHQATDPFVEKDGRTTVISQQFLDKLIDEVQRLRADVDNHETRITTLEP